MKHMREQDIEWTPWFQALSAYEQEYWWECENKRIEAKELVHSLFLEQNRLRQRGHVRARRDREQKELPA